MKIMRYIAGWVVVTALVTLAAWQVVGAAAARVSEMPAAPLIADASVALSAAITGSTSGTSSTTSTTSTTQAPPNTSPTSSTTSSTPTSTQPSGSATIPSPGGTVTVSYADGKVYLEGASPSIGYSVEIDKQGPEEVKVEFESAGGDVTVSARWSSGRLVTEVETSDH